MEETPEQYAKRVLEIILKSKDLTLDSPIFPENQGISKAEPEKDSTQEAFKKLWTDMGGEWNTPKPEEMNIEQYIEKTLKELEAPESKPKDKPKKNPIDEMLEKANKGEPIEP